MSRRTLAWPFVHWSTETRGARTFDGWFVFPFAGRATGSELAVVASLCWWAFWLLLTMRVVLPRLRAGLGRAAWVAAGLYLVIAASLGLRVAETELRDTAIVTAPGGTSVRFEPSLTGTRRAAPRTRHAPRRHRARRLQVRRRRPPPADPTQRRRRLQ
jgi:hypothetical protein